MHHTSGQFDRYLAVTPVVDWQHDSVRALANDLSDSTVTQTAKRCFEWVRDEVRHSSDHQCDPVTCIASEVLEHRTGYCYAKSHLLAALLRANRIPAGFCYQRLSLDGQGPPFSLHGLNAVYLQEHGWYRIDPRGNRQGVNADFCPPQEILAFSVSVDGERDLPEIWADPLPVVIEALQSQATWDAMLANLPDIDLLDI